MEYVFEYAVDAVIILMLIFTVINSARRGLLKCICSLVCVALALFAAFSFSQTAAEWSYDNLLSGYVESKVSQAISEGFDSESAAQTVMATIDMIPEILTAQLTEFGIDINALSEQISSLQLSADDTAQKISVQIIRPGALVLLRLLCYILIFVAVRFVSGAVLGLIIRIPDKGILHKANKWLGAAIGAVKGVVIAFIICLLLNAVAAFIQPGGEIQLLIENSRICEAVSTLGAPDLSSINSGLNNNQT